MFSQLAVLPLLFKSCNFADLMANTTDNNTQSLNEQQRAAVEFKGRNLLVLAGAGTGKTRTIIARARHLLKNGVSPERILILSFTRKSAKEIVDRLQSALPKRSAEMKGCTFHSWCMELIESNPQVFNFGKYSVIDEDDRNSAFNLICGRNFKASNFIKPEQLSDVYSYMVNACCNLSKALQVKIFNGRTDKATRNAILGKRPVYEAAIRKYIEFKAQHRYLDYDDILHRVATGLARNEEAARHLASHYDHILIDEMQDTNPLQYKLLKSFWDHVNLFCVGDDAQSIYGFRGADFQSVHHFTEVVPDAEVMRLTLNYRSTQQILDFANWVLQRSPLNYDKNLKADRGKGELPMLIHYAQEWDQARDVVMRIRNSVGMEGCKYADNMVLSRSNYGMRSVEACLIEAGIPYIIFGGTSLMKSAHVRDVVSALRIVANYRDELAWMRYLKLFPGVGDITAAKIIAKLLEKQTLRECLETLVIDFKMPGEAASTLQAIYNLQAEVGKAIQAAFSGLEKQLKSHYKDDWEARSRDLPILQMIGNAAESLTAFLSEYLFDPSLELGQKNESKPDDHVILTTIHSAKGLEARNCYILNVSYNNFPSSHAIELGDEAVEEDRRCLYVALTRAKDRLFIYRSIRAVRVLDPEAEENCSKSYFLNNLPPALYRFGDVRDASNVWTEYKGKSIKLEDTEDFDFS